jgi:hypothetical protein
VRSLFPGWRHSSEDDVSGGPSIPVWRFVLSGLLFNVGWFSCILASRYGVPLGAWGLVAAIVFVHLALTAKAYRRSEALSALVITVLGAALDTAMLSAGVLRFQGSSEPTLTFVLWIAAFWLNFAILLGVALRWLRGRWWLSVLLGAVSAPGTYYAGELLGALELGELMGDTKRNAMIAIGVEWAIALPVIVWISARFEERLSDSPPRAAESCRGG